MRLAAWVLTAVVVTGAARPVAAQSGPVAPTGGPPEAKPALAFDPSPTGSSTSLPPETPTQPARRASTAPDEKIPNVLGAPVLGAPVRAADREPERQDNVRPASGTRSDSLPPDPLPPEAPAHTTADRSSDDPPPVRRGALGAPESAGGPVPAQAIEGATRSATSPGTPTGPDAMSELLSRRRRDRRTERDLAEERSSGKFGDKIGETLGDVFGKKGDSWFRSDHAFDGFISPVTNPFLFEDPRSLTEVRPIFMYQRIPDKQKDFRGGNVWFFGTQARVAVTDRLSFVLNKLGGVSINPANSSPFSGEVGFAELWFGPKFTFVRNEDKGRVIAGGLQFQVPLGSPGTFQNTGNLSLVPYISYAENFGKDWRLGSVNAMLSTGYAFGTNKDRSDYYYLSAHADFDVMNNHRFYPLAELNWITYTTNGKTLPIGSEGRDLFNFGGQAKGRGLLTGAVGARFKISESAQIGAAFEVPLAGPKDLFKYRFTLDFILRY